MRFGGKRAPGYLLVARSLVYLQAGLLLVMDGWAALAALGAGNFSVQLSGLISHADITGSGVLLFALIQAAIAIGLVYLDFEAERNAESYRGTFTAVEVGFALYMILFIDTAGGAWIFGPLLGIAVICLHWWPELDRKLLGGSTPAPEPTPASTVSPAAPVAGPPGPGISASASPPAPPMPWAVPPAPGEATPALGPRESQIPR